MFLFGIATTGTMDFVFLSLVGIFRVFDLMEINGHLIELLQFTQ